jgi:hypothetical protein
MTPEQKKILVDRFLQWKLPADFMPDAGISFKPVYNETSPTGPMRHEPVGTNLFTAAQAMQMVEFMCEGLKVTCPECDGEMFDIYGAVCNMCNGDGGVYPYDQ